MNHWKSIVISCAVCAIIIAVVMGIYCWPIEIPFEAAESNDQLELFVKFQTGTEKINIWQDEEGTYYFFLPSGIEDCKVTFGNLGKKSMVSLNGQLFDRQDDLTSFLAALSPKQKNELILKVSDIEQQPIEVVFLKSENIASMYIDTLSGSTENIHADKETKEPASMRLLDSMGMECYNDSIEYIKGRGNSTWAYEKKPYQIKLNKKSELLDMPAAKKWILLANVLDDSLMKNEIVFRYAEKYTTVPSIRGEYVDLYINGDYRGNYYLCEKVEVDDNRLNIRNQDAAMKKINSDYEYDNSSLYVSEDGHIKAVQGLKNPEDITGGYLLEYITQEEFEQATNAFQTERGHSYAIVSPCPATVEQAEYICGLFNEMENAMAQEDAINPSTGKHVSEYLDLDSWASKYLMEEVFSDPDAVFASMYLYKDCDSIDSHIYSGPMWDYDRALGSYGVLQYNMDNPRQIGKYGIYVEQLMSIPEVCQMVYKKFEEEMIPYVEKGVQADIYEINQKIEASAKLDMIRWNQISGYYTERNANVDYLAYFLEEKKEYLKDVWLEEADYCSVTFLDYAGNTYKTYQVKKGERLGEAPSIVAFTALFAGWYVQGENIPYVPELPVYTDVTYESRWIDIDIVLQNGLNNLDIDVSQLDPEVFEAMAELIRERQKNDNGETDP